MISSHCGKDLKYLHGTFEDCATGKKYHKWICTVCGREFKQAIRTPKKI